MARVFLSYRRADGRYAVGWIAERLSRLDEVTDLRSAFEDSDLRCGDDYPAALAAEIESCDLFIAVIGPHWLGKREDGTSRILDESDWVGREVGSALEAGKRILPVLLGGVEPLNRGELPDHLAPLADRHALPFGGAADLDVLASHVRSHLEEIDRERARVAGLEKPIRLGSFRVGPVVMAAALLAAVIGAAAGFALTQAFVGDGDQVAAFQEHDTLWAVASVVEIALWAALGTVGHYYLWTHFRTLVRIRWRPVVLSFLVTSLLLAWLVAVFATKPPLAWGTARMWASLTLALVLLAPWILTLLGAAWTTPTTPRHELGERARLIGQLDRVGWVATAVLSVAALPPIAVAAGAQQAFEDAGMGDSSQPLVIPLAALLTATIIALLVQSRVEVRNDSTALRLDMATIAPNLRRHGEAVLVTRLIDPRQWWLLIWLALPTAFAIVLTVWL